MLNVGVVLGTRPEAIKLSPVIKELQRHPNFRVIVIHSGQHRELGRDVLELFGIEPHVNVEVMNPAEDLASLLANGVLQLSKEISRLCVQVLIVQGDTTTALAGALAAAYLKVPIVHVEAGLRSFDSLNPFPEETNRVLIGQLADLHMAPTDIARGNLIKEGVPVRKIFVTGNTGIDALLEVSALWPNSVSKELVDRLPETFPRWPEGRESWIRSKLILVTLHRRETHGPDLDQILLSLKHFACSHSEHVLIFPAHPNPNVQRSIRELQESETWPRNFVICKPLEYRTFVGLMKAVQFVVTDSGGIQEEAPTLGVRVVVTRRATERLEAVHEGRARLVTNYSEDLTLALEEEAGKDNACSDRVPWHGFGDGAASRRIVDILHRRYCAYDSYQTVSPEQVAQFQDLVRKC